MYVQHRACCLAPREIHVLTHTPSPCRHFHPSALAFLHLFNQTCLCQALEGSSAPTCKPLLCHLTLSLLGFLYHEKLFTDMLLCSLLSLSYNVYFPRGQGLFMSFLSLISTPKDSDIRFCCDSSTVLSFSRNKIKGFL